MFASAASALLFGGGDEDLVIVGGVGGCLCYYFGAWPVLVAVVESISELSTG